MIQLVTFFLSFLLLTCSFEAQTELIRCRWKAYEVSYPTTITSHQRGNTYFPNFPIRAPLRIMKYFVGGRVSEGSSFCTYVFVTILRKPILRCSMACWFLFVKLLYYTAYFFSKTSPNFLFFFWFCQACSLKN